MERTVLDLILSAYPELFTERDLLRLIAKDSDDFGERDAVERATLSLYALGLLHLCGPLVIPSRTALRIRSMEDDEATE